MNLRMSPPTLPENPARPSCVASFHTHTSQLRQTRFDLIHRFHRHHQRPLAAQLRHVRHLGLALRTINPAFLLWTEPQPSTPLAILQLHRHQKVIQAIHDCLLGTTTSYEFANDQRPTANDRNKKPRAGFPDTGLVSLTMTCLRYLVMNAE